MPPIIAAVVIRIGRSRTGPRPATPRPACAPAARGLAKSTSRMAFLVTSPISMMKPIIEKMLSVVPVSSSARNTPMSENGSDAMIASGCVKLANCDARIR